MHHSKHSKRTTFALIVILIVIGLIFPIITGYAKEEKSAQQTLSPTSVAKKDIIINLTKEGEIWIENEKVDLDSIKGRIEDFKNEYPDGNVIITCDKDLFNNKAIAEVIDQIRAAKVKDVVVAATKEE